MGRDQRSGVYAISRRGRREDRDVESIPPRRLVRRIVGETDFGGTWTSELDAEPGGGTRLVITENGEIHNAFFRFVSRYIVGHHRTIDSFIAALRRHLEARGG